LNTEPQRKVVIGVGNRWLSDEGIGCHVAAEVASLAPPGTEVVEAGLAGCRLPELLQGKNKAVIIDAVDGGQPPGTVYRLDSVESAVNVMDRNCSLHQGNILSYVALARALGMCPREVIVIGIQPESIAPGNQVSPSLRTAMRTAVDMVLMEVGAWRESFSRKNRR
jgi:hydrogenase maturation protease